MEFIKFIDQLGIKSYKKHENFIESENSLCKIIKMHFTIINIVFIRKIKKSLIKVEKEISN